MKNISVLFVSVLYFFCNIINNAKSQNISNYTKNVRVAVGYDFVVANPVFGNQYLIGMHCECNQLEAGVPKASPSARRFYYIPFMALHKDENGEFMIQERTKGEVTIPLTYTFEQVGSIFRRHLIDNGLINESTLVGNIQMASFNKVIIETNPTYRHKIRFEIPELLPRPHGQISTRIDDQSILSEFISDFRSGKVSLRATLFFSGYNTLENIARIDFESLKNTDVYNDIVGNGGKGIVNRQKIGKLAKQALAI